MIELSINNEKQAFAEGVTVASMLEAAGFAAEKVAVAVNTEFVARSEYVEFVLKQGDSIDVLAPVQGG